MKKWYAEECLGGWTLNESIPDGSDGWIADFGVNGEDACRLAAHAHNLFNPLVDMLKKLLACMDESANVMEYSKTWRLKEREEARTLIEQAEVNP